MFLPPFFGFTSKYDEKFIYRAVQDYLAADIVTYTDPSARAIVTFMGSDILTYNSQIPSGSLVSYLTTDILSYKQPDINQPALLSYMICDILCYELESTIPGPIENVYARDKDSLGIVSWSIPDNGKSPLLDYIIEYKTTGEINWSLYNDGIGTGILSRVGSLTNNLSYEFRVAAVNANGTGVFTTSNIIIPSGGVDNDCDMIMYTNLDSTDRNFITVTGCNRPGSLYVTDYVITGIIGSGMYNTNYWEFPGSLISLQNNPHDGYNTFPHMHVTQGCSKDWSLIDNFTLSLWMKPTKQGDSSTQTLLSASSESGNYNSWKIYYDISNSGIGFMTGTTNSTMTNIVSITGLNIPTTGFTHVAVSRSNNYVSLFINGIEKHEKYSSGNLSINSNYLIIGAYPYEDYYNFSNIDGWGLTVEGFGGGIDEIIVSRSAFYRGDFIPPSTAHSTSFDCPDCSGCPYGSDVVVLSLIDNTFIP